MNLVLSVLLVTCADDVAVAVPLAFSAAIGIAAKRGMIFKGGAFLEGITKVKTIIVDKTGTITRGKLKVTEIISLNKASQEEIMKIAASADCFSEHPIAKAIMEYTENKKINYSKPKDFEEFAEELKKKIQNLTENDF